MKAPIQVVAEGEFIRINDQSEIPQPANTWYGFPIEFASTTNVKYLRHAYNPNPILLHLKGGATKTEVDAGNKKYVIEAGPRSTTISQEKFESLHVHFSYYHTSELSGVFLELQPAVLNQLFPDEFKTINLDGVQVAQDKTIEGLLTLMETEVRSGCHSGRLYAEGLSIALVSYLIENYTNRKIEAKRTQKFSQQIVNKLTSYIKDNLGNELSINELANLVHMSPFHFSRVFAASMDMPPHRFITESRILEVQRLLKTDLSLSDIAQVTGFSSQGHLSTVIKRRFGFSPTEVRKQLGGN